MLNFDFIYLLDLPVPVAPTPTPAFQQFEAAVNDYCQGVQHDDDGVIDDAPEKEGRGRPKFVSLSTNTFYMTGDMNFVPGTYHFGGRNTVEVAKQVWSDNEYVVLKFSKEIQKNGKQKAWSYSVPINYIDGLMKALTKIRNNSGP